MPNFNDVCLKILNENQQFITVAVVESDSALLLGFATNNDTMSLEYYEALAASIVNIYIGRNTKTVEKMIASMRGDVSVPGLHEIQLNMEVGNVFISPLDDLKQFLVFVIAPEWHNIENVWDKVRYNIGETSAILKAI